MFFGVDNLRNLVSSIGAYITALRSAESAEIAAAAGAKALRLGLDLLVNSLALAGIMLAVKGLTLLVDKIVVTKEELAEVRQEALRGLESVKESSEQLVEDTKNVAELVKQYRDIAESTDGIAGSEDALKQIQDSLIDKLGDHADGLDIVNGKYKEQIQLIEDAVEAQRKDWEYRHAADIENAKKLSEYNVGWASVQTKGWGSFNRVNERVNPDGDYAQIFTPDEIDRADEFAASLYKIKGLSKDIRRVYKDIKGVSATEGISSTQIRLSGGVKDAIKETEELIDAYKKVEDYDEKTLKALSDHYAELKDIWNNAQEFMQTDIEQSIVPPLFEVGTGTDALTQLEALTVGVDEARTKWFENLHEMDEGLGKTVDSMISALQSLAKGDGLSGEDFWNISSFDVDGILTNVKLVGDKFFLNEQQLIELKDSYIRKQIDSLEADNESLKIKRAELETSLAQSKIEFEMLSRRGGADAQFRKELEGAKIAIEQGEKGLAACEEEIRLTTLRTDQWRSKLGDCRDESQRIADIQERITKAQKEADEYANAMLSYVQDRIDDYGKEKQALENQKEILNEHLDILNEKKEAIEDTIEQYKSIVDVVKDISDAEIDALEARQEAEEEAVQSRIDALKEEKDQKEDAASLDEKQLELRKKLAELDKAKTTKVRTYSAARGWHFDVDAEAVNAAQSAADDAQKAYDTAVSNQQYDNEVKALEAQKKAISDNYKAQIKAQEDYYKQWSEITEAQEKAEKEQLAEQILGSNYREKIKDKDTGILKKFEGDFRSYNAQLNNLVNGEIASLQLSIKAKDEEIKAKGKQIEEWQRYKAKVEETINSVKSKYENYITLLKNVNIEESNSYAEREKALEQFAAQYGELMGVVAEYQRMLEPIRVSAVFDDREVRDNLAQFIADYRTAIDAMGKALEASATGFNVVHSGWDAKLAEAYNIVKHSHAQGGVVDYTGLAMLHGSKNSSETIFNAAQSRELYDMVRSGSFAAQVADKAYMGLRTAMTKMNTTTNNSTNSNITIQQMTIKANNPMEFHSQFMQEMGQYWNVKLTESRIK